MRSSAHARMDGALLVLPLAVLALWSVRPAGPGSWTLAGYRALGAEVNGITPVSSAILPR